MDDLHSAKDFTDRSRAFLTLNRQMTQVITDYDILEATILHLQREHASPAFQSFPRSAEFSPRTFNDDVWEFFLAEVRLLRTYGKLFESRTKIGINEVFPHDSLALI